ncbi:MAG: RHS repeat-associated core domain-containing protein [Acidobacteriota bacterium]
MSYTFRYDAAENLDQIRRTGRCGTATTKLPPDSRNRPASINGYALTWDAAGRLREKGEHRFVYDAQGRLVEVRRISDDAVVASYAYDILNRRISRTVNGTTYRTVWDGWRALEEYELVDGGAPLLTSRRTFGTGLDHILELEQRLPNGLATFHPVYDSVGSVAALLDADGDIVERYDYSPYGERTVTVDTTPPAVQQVRLGVTLTDPTTGEAIPFAANRPVLSGPGAKKRIVLTPGAPIEAGAQLRLVVAKTAVRDFFDQTATADVDEALTWTASGASVLTDTAAPTVQAVCLIDKKLVVDWSEPVSAANADAQLTLNGATTDWTTGAAGYSVELTSPLAAGSYVLEVGDGPLDLAAVAAEPAGPFAFTVGPGSDHPTIFEAEPPDRVATSTVGNNFGFHGLTHDPETGLIYARHRMLDPELGRFIMKDPLGYVDGPSAYQFATNNPVSYSDPLGLQVMPSQEDFRHMQNGRQIAERETRISDLEQRIAFLRLKVDLRVATAPWLEDPLSRRHQAADLLRQNGYGQEATTSILTSTFQAGTSEPGSATIASYVTSRIGGTGEISEATLDLVLAAGPLAGGAVGFADDSLRVLGPRLARAGNKIQQELASLNSRAAIQPVVAPWPIGRTPRVNLIPEIRYHYGPQSAIDEIRFGVIEARDVAPPMSGTPKAWLTRIAPEQMTGPFGWFHRLRLGFSPSTRVPTPHLRKGRLVYQVEDAYIAIDVTGVPLQPSPPFKAPLGGQEFAVQDVLTAGRTIRFGGL